MGMITDIISAKHVYVTLEYPDGSVVHGKCYVATVTVEQQAMPYFTFDSNVPIISASRPLVTMELVANGEILLSESSEYVERVEKERISPEWKCWYCGRPNKSTRETCESCNAVRQFVYR